MEHLNYCRQITKQLKRFGSMNVIDEVFLEQKARLQHAADLAVVSRKFILPKDGVLIDDLEFRALDGIELKLPFPAVALEFEVTNRHGWTKRVQFAVQDEDEIRLTDAYFQPNDGGGLWLFTQTSAIRGDLLSGIGGPPEERKRVLALYSNDDYPILHLLNALSCSNVRIIESHPKKLRKKVKSALPFDTYHVLTVDVGRRGNELPGAGGGTHRSPREHLRRGHIRRLADGRRIWVNAAVVGAGKGVGVVAKDYQVRCHG